MQCTLMLWLLLRDPLVLQLPTLSLPMLSLLMLRLVLLQLKEYWDLQVAQT